MATSRFATPLYRRLAAGFWAGILIGTCAGPLMAAPAEQEAGQDGDEQAPAFKEETWLGDGEIDHGGYGGAVVRASQLNGDAALFVGGRGGWLIDHHLVLGGGGMGQALNLAATPEAVLVEPNARNLEFGYGGLFVGYHFLPEYLFHGVASLLIGGGGLTLSDRAGNEENMKHQSDAVFVLEPELALEVNIVEFMRAQLTLSYRRTWGVSFPGLDNDDVSGVSGGIALMFGDF